MKTFDNKHLFFDEALEYQAIAVGVMSALTLKLAHKRIDELFQAIVKMNNSPSAKTHGVVDVPSVSAEFNFKGGVNDNHVVLHGCDAMYRSMIGDSPHPVAVSISVYKPTDGAARLDLWKSKHPKHGVISGNNQTPLNVATVQLLLRAYEKVRVSIENHYGHEHRLWPVELQFFRLLRHACGHGNQFNITARPTNPSINVSNPPKWNGYVLGSDTSVNGKRAIGGEFPTNQLLPLLYDMGVTIKPFYTP